MSGGQWNYVQDKLMHICADIRMQMGRETYEEEVEQRLLEAVKVIAIAAVYIERIDWLFSGDDGDDDFVRRLNEELPKDTH